nr:hypothetical protein [Tanacetum cinerariifolium]
MKTIKPSGGMMCQGVRKEIQTKGVIGDSIHFDTLARKKFGFVDETIKQPKETDKDAEDWWTINSLLFSIANGPRIQQLKYDLANCQKKGLTIVSYYGRLKQIWDELANYDQITTCTYGKCKCELEKNLAKKQKDEKVHTFLMGLDENVYGTTRSKILAQDPLPNMNKVYSILIQEERVKTMTRDKDDRPEIMELVGYPEWWGERPRVERKGVVTIKVHLLDEEEVEEIVVPLELIQSKQEELVPTMERVI